MGYETKSEAESLYFQEFELMEFVTRTCTTLGLSDAHAKSIAKVLVAGQRDDCQSHGVYRLLTCAQTIKTGKVKLDAAPVVEQASPAIVRVHADYGFSPLAFELGLPALVAAARSNGLAALVINRCVHFTALWPEIEAITAHGLASLALTPSHSWVAPAGGKRPTFGTNPIAFGWPRPVGKNPYVFDFATSAIARGDLELHRRAGQELPLGCGVDEHGQPTRDPQAIIKGAMTTFGGHKGSALATMVELLGGALIGDWNSKQSLDFDSGAGAAPCHGELILAFEPGLLGSRSLSELQQMAEELFGRILDQGARLPSQRRYEARQRSQLDGIAVPRLLYEEIVALGRMS